MDKLPKDLPKEEKLNYILQLIDKGYDRKCITENMGYSRPDSLDRFITKFGFTVDKETNKYARQMEDTCPTEVIEIVSGLQINYNKSEVIKTTVRVDKNIWNEFSNLCIDKYSQFSKIDILSQLLHEFIEKYK